MENTEAESVEDMVEANSREAVSPKAPPHPVLFVRNQMQSPVVKEVRNTPSVAKTRPGAITGRISWILVSMPPENRMIQSATVPIVCAVSMLSKWIPSPSEPKTIPTHRNNSNAGTPRRFPALLTTMLTKKSNDTTNITNSTFIQHAISSSQSVNPPLSSSRTPCTPRKSRKYVPPERARESRPWS